jgi:hypothetical protein
MRGSRILRLFSDLSPHPKVEPTLLDEKQGWFFAVNTMGIETSRQKSFF